MQPSNKGSITEDFLHAINAWFKRHTGSSFHNGTYNGGRFNCIAAHNITTSYAKLIRNKEWMLETLRIMQRIKTLEGY